MDFLVHTTEKREYDDEIQSLGSKVLFCRVPSRPLTYAKNFYRTVHDFGPYDVIHSHVHYYSGYVLRLARRAGIPVRIAIVIATRRRNGQLQVGFVAYLLT